MATILTSFHEFNARKECVKSRPIGNPWKNLPGNPFFWGFMVIFVMQKSRVLVNFSYDKKKKKKEWDPKAPLLTVVPDTLTGYSNLQYRIHMRGMR